jgi:hypothetical protein
MFPSVYVAQDTVERALRLAHVLHVKKVHLKHCRVLVHAHFVLQGSFQV